MTTKLTLTIEKDVISLAKKYAADNNRSLSDLVENYLKSLQITEHEKPLKLSRKVRKLKGIISVADDFDYKKVLAKELSKKYLGV